MINAIIYRVIVIGIGFLLFAAGMMDIKNKQISRRMIVVLLLACCAILHSKIFSYFGLCWEEWQ